MVIEITDRAGLEAMASGLSDDYILMNDIDLGGSATPWTPIGTTSAPFTGTFDGGGYKISNMYISATIRRVGFFGYLSGGGISKLGLCDVSVTSTTTHCGGICGYSAGSISDCYTTGSISGNTYCGGICGASTGSISDCYTTGSVSGNNDCGGICGYSTSSISNCYSTGSVSGNTDCGGICGYSTSSISNCYSTGSVSGNNDCGGICGYSTSSGSISNCYSTGSVSGDNDCGGICGYSAGSISDCYTTGSVSGTNYCGGICGRNYGGTLQNNVSYTPDIIATSNYGRITGSNTGTLTDNYGYVDTPLNSATNTWTDSTTGVDGGDATASNFVSEIWWVVYPKWSFANDSAWCWDSSTNLPNLRVFYTVITKNPIRRYKIVLRDGDNVCIVTRNKTLSSMPRFTSLEFGSIVCESGEASFTLIGANRLETSLFDALIKQGTDVFILDDESVVWAGHIFNVAETNTQYYNNAINTPPSMHTVKCMDSIDKLSTMEYSGDVGLVSDTIENIITGTLTHEGILPEGYSGIIGYSDEADIELDTTQRTVFTYEITDRLTLLNQLSDSTGWRYRCRPNVIARHAAVTINDIGYNYVNFTIDNGLSDYQTGDMFYLKLAQESTDISGFALFTAANVTIGADTTYILSKAVTTIVYKPVTPTALSVNYGLVWRGYVYDFAPSFYQQSTVKDYTINKHAFDVSNASAISDKHGVVSAYSRSMTNEYVTSNWKLFMVINKNYTIPSAYVITNSSDSYVTDIVRLAPAALGYVYLHLKGWTTPTTVADYQAMNPSFYIYTGGAYVRKTFPTNASNIGCIRTIERCINSNGDKYTKIGLNDYNGEFFDSYPVVIGTEIICDRYELHSGIGLTAGDYVMIGDEPQMVVSKVGDDTLVVYRTVSPNTSYPQVANMHGHMTGTLVFKTTTLGVTATDIQTDSPMDKYGEVILSKKATDGYTRMELERVAQNFAQYGSNYTDQGTASIPLGYFEKPDVTFGTTVATSLIAGDHISLSSRTASTLDYELLGYENKTDKMMVSVTYGMPTWNIAYVVYGIYSNGSLTINPPDYE